MNMNSYIFQCRSETTDPKQIPVTLEKLSHYMNKTFKSTADFDPIFSRCTTNVLPKTIKLEDLLDVDELAMFNKDVK